MITAVSSALRKDCTPRTCGVGEVGADVEGRVYCSVRERLEVLQQAL